jgi:beta-glucanase (GH16 family)
VYSFALSHHLPLRRSLIFIALAVLTAATASIGLNTRTAHASPPSSAFTLVFDDEFNNSSVNTSVWNYRTDSKGYSVQQPANVTEGGGYLTINLKQQQVGSYDFTGGGVVSKQSFRYGYYETRAKINDGSGWHSSFWLQCGTGSTTFPACQRTEIDGFEIDSANPQNISHEGVITWKGSGVHNSYSAGRSYNTGVDLRQWHTYGIDWEENSVTFYFDGTATYTAPYTPSTWTHDYTNIWLTSIAYGTTPDTTKLPSSVQFDYARYYQKDYYVDNDGPAAYGYSETGSWFNSTLTGWTVGSPTRYATCGSAGNTATWRPHIRAAGTYEVFVWKTVYSNTDSNARYDLAYNGGTATSYINGTTGSSGWVSLGTHPFAAGTAGYVKVTSSGSGCARADAVKFVRT